MSRVWKNIIRFAALLDHSHLTWRKVLELLLLRWRLWRDHLKAGGHKHALSILRAGLRAGAAD